MDLPLNDLQRHAESLKRELREAVESVLTSGRYLHGPWVERFESDFASYCGARHAVAVANGTDALELALRAAGCGPGDDVVTVANAGGYATTAILHAGATPVYAEIDPRTFLITPDSLLAAATPATKAVVVTHLYGLMADMPALCRDAATRGIVVVEDCAQAQGPSIQGKKAGSWGALGCFSFYPSKNLGAIGDAGCVVTDDDELAEGLRGLRQYGWQPAKFYSPKEIGRNSRMDELQAAVLVRLLKYLDGWNDKRRQIVARYRAALASDDVLFQQVDRDESYAAHLCVLRSSERERLARTIESHQIATDVHYPVPDYGQPAVINRIGRKPALPITEQVSSEILTLPCFPEMTEEEVGRVIAAVQHHHSRVAL